MKPKISIVTPNFNQAAYIEETILSVIGQHYPNLEYIIIDGGSTDGSIDIIKKYEKNITYWISEPDAGLYHALQKGFDKATGDVFGWLNSDDKLHPDALGITGEIFESFEQVNWITGCPSGFDEKGRTTVVADTKRWSKYDFYLYNYKWIQQESTFWRRSLWQKAGAALDLNVKYAADFELWMRFFRHDKLFTVRTILGGFRFRSSAQISFLHREKYLKEVEDLIAAEIIKLPAEVKNNLARHTRLQRVKRALHRMKIFSVMLPAPVTSNSISDAPAFIEFDQSTQQFRLGN